MKNSKNQKKDESENLPGYPHYPDNEDILNTTENKTTRIDADIEDLSKNPSVNSVHPQKNPSGKSSEIFADVEGTADLRNSDADLTPDDIAALGEDGLNMDDGDDEILRNRPYADIAGDAELDIPGAELDDDSEDIGSEDEENNYYSLGDN
jgi:hypothetical protein